MPNRNINRIDQKGRGGNGGTSSPHIYSVKVKHCILNGNEIGEPANPYSADKWGGPDAVGLIFFNKLPNDENSHSMNIDHYAREDVDSWEGEPKPLFPFIKYSPLVNETVLIIQTTSKNYLKRRGAVENYYFPPINLFNHPHHNTLPALRNYLEEKDMEVLEADDYDQAGLLRKSTDEELEYNIPLGNYFSESLGIHPLLPYEGDTIIEGRFGNSFRMGATARHKEETVIPPEHKNSWSNGTKGSIGDPITIIRNGQSVALDDQGWLHALEDINLDPSSIYMTSNQSVNTLIIASDAWNTFGINASIPQNDQNEAQKLLDDPANFIQDEKEVEADVFEEPENNEIETEPTQQEEVKETQEEQEEIQTESTGSISEEEAGLEEEATGLRYYDTPIDPEKEAIDSKLPENYRLSDLDDVPAFYTTWPDDILYYNRPTEADGKARCLNCANFNSENSQCAQWGAKVRNNFYCNSYSNVVKEKLRDIKQIGRKYFEIVSPNSHKGKEGYVEQTIDVNGEGIFIEYSIYGVGKDKTPEFPFHADVLEIVRSIGRAKIPELLGAPKDSVFWQFEDLDFDDELGTLPPPPGPPPGPFDYLLNKGRLGKDLYHVAGIGKTKKPGKATDKGVIAAKEDSRQKALQLIYDSHYEIRSIYPDYNDYLSVITIEAIEQLHYYDYPELTKPISKKEWSIGWRWKIVELIYMEPF